MARGIFRAIPPRTLSTLTPGARASSSGKHFVFTSDDAGHTWARRGVLPMLHARPFTAGRGVYVLGHAGDLRIARSGDDGTTWSEAADLTNDQWWHQAACSVEHANGKVYLVMERRTQQDMTRWDVSALAPVLMAAPEDADLLPAQLLALLQRGHLPAGGDRGRPAGRPGRAVLPHRPPGGAAHGDTPMAAPGWLETNVVRFRDPRTSGTTLPGAPSTSSCAPIPAAPTWRRWRAGWRTSRAI